MSAINNVVAFGYEEVDKKLQEVIKYFTSISISKEMLAQGNSKEEIKEFLLSASLPIQYSWFGELIDVTEYPYG